MENKKRMTEKITTADISWESGVELLLNEIKIKLSDLLEGSQFYLERNSTLNEKSIDIFRYGEDKRIGSIWPKSRKRCVDLLLRNEYADSIRLRMEMPPYKEQNKLPNFRVLKAIPIEKLTEIICFLGD